MYLHIHPGYHHIVPYNQSGQSDNIQPDLSKGKPYQVHSIEPGLYGKSVSQGVEFGVRIENCVYSDLHFNKISLSKFPFEEVLIDYSLLTIKEIEIVKKWQESSK